MRKLGYFFLVTLLYAFAAAAGEWSGFCIGIADGDTITVLKDGTGNRSGSVSMALIVRSPNRITARGPGKWPAIWPSRRQSRSRLLTRTGMVVRLVSSLPMESLSIVPWWSRAWPGSIHNIAA